MRATHKRPVFDIIEFSFPSAVERVLRSVPSREEADRIVANLSQMASPATYFYWVTRA